MVQRRKGGGGGRRFGGVLVPASGFVLLQGRAIEVSFERRRAELQGELAGVAGDGSAADQAGGILGIAITGGAENGGNGHAQPIAEGPCNRNALRQFVTSDGIGTLKIF